ncbi:MAG: nitroreductase family protein [Pseudobutyrivibrio sp.]|nr:nitroreductase family protein [Pseudobutyrivibrio sp.]
MREAILNRISRRTFTEEALNQEEISKIQAMLDEINQEAGLALSLMLDGEEAFANRSKSYGMFKNVKAILVMKADPSLENVEEKIGYYGQALMLDLTDMGLGSCWVAGTFNKDYVEIPEGQEMYCVIPVGHIDKVTMKEKMIRGTISKNRKPISERLTGSEDAPQWVLEAMKAVQLAPTAVNSQHPHFTYAGGKLTADVSGEWPTDLVDLGIAKKNFEEAAGGCFDLGNGAEFHKN